MVMGIHWGGQYLRIYISLIEMGKGTTVHYFTLVNFKAKMKGSNTISIIITSSIFPEQPYHAYRHRRKIVVLDTLVYKVVS